MVDLLVYEVRSEKIRANISHSEILKSAKSPESKKKKVSTDLLQIKCPKCEKGSLLKGTSAYGCSDYKIGCDFRIPYLFFGKKISENQLKRLLHKGCTVNLKGFKKEGVKVEGLVRFDANFQLILEEKRKYHVPDKIICPKCNKGTILKGKTAYGCSNHNIGCDFIYSFGDVRNAAAGKILSKELVYQILHGIS